MNMRKTLNDRRRVSNISRRARESNHGPHDLTSVVQTSILRLPETNLIEISMHTTLFISMITIISGTHVIPRQVTALQLELLQSLRRTTVTNAEKKPRVSFYVNLAVKGSI